MQGQLRHEPRPEVHSGTGKVPHLTPQLLLATGSHEPKHCWHTDLYDRLVLRERMNWQIVVSDSDWASTCLVLLDTPQFKGFTSSRFLLHSSYFCLLKEMLFFFTFWKTLWISLGCYSNTPLANSYFGNSCQVCSTIFILLLSLKSVWHPWPQSLSHWFLALAS